MDQYARPDQYYIDKYDRGTIKELKELEKNLPADFILRSDFNALEILELSVRKNKSISKFFHEASSIAKIREEVIKKWKESDLRKDKLINDFPIPKNIHCNTCKREMIFATHIFNESFEEQILFAFSCPAGHIPNKVVYPHGREFHVKEMRCKHCGGKLKSQKEKKPNLLIFTDTCASCGKKEVMEFALTDNEEPPIDEAERTKYCLQFMSIPRFYSGLEKLAELGKFFKEQAEEDDIKKFYEVDKIQKTTVPTLENHLKKETEKAGYTKFEFTKTDLAKVVIVTFQLNDPSERTEKESIKQLSKLLDATLFPRNWRLIPNAIEYRLGVLIGKLRAYDTESDLLELAKKIQAKNKTRKNE